jgi:hypothetical protein
MFRMSDIWARSSYPGWIAFRLIRNTHDVFESESPARLAVGKLMACAIAGAGRLKHQPRRGNERIFV